MGALAMGRVNTADLDAVTLDAYGTLVTLVDPVPELSEALRRRGADHPPEVVRAGFRAEVAHYQVRAGAGYDEASLAQLQEECARVFLDTVGADLDAAAFAPVYAAAMHFDVLPGVRESLERLRALGLELAVVANWDTSLRHLLAEAGLTRYFTLIVHAAAKPAPDALLRALGELGVEPGRALHIGDDEVDELAARAAPMQFAPAPIPGAVASLA
jgi:HAD superfamily hydrolase (TIGR01509 family)